MRAANRAALANSSPYSRSSFVAPCNHHQILGGLSAVQNLAYVDAAEAICVLNAGAVAHQSAGDGPRARIVDRGNRVPCRQRHNLIASIEEDRVAADDDRINPMLDELRERLLEVVLAVSTDEVELQPERKGGRLEVSGLAHGEGIVGVQEITDHAGCGHQLVEQLQPFCPPTLLARADEVIE
jgi:hypothetical protein